jgi:hypothetical protein
LASATPSATASAVPVQVIVPPRALMSLMASAL